MVVNWPRLLFEFNYPIWIRSDVPTSQERVLPILLFTISNKKSYTKFQAHVIAFFTSRKSKMNEIQENI